VRIDDRRGAGRVTRLRWIGWCVEGLKGKGMVQSDRNGQSEPRIALSGMLNDESTLLAPSPPTMTDMSDR